MRWSCQAKPCASTAHPAAPPGTVPPNLGLAWATDHAGAPAQQSPQARRPRDSLPEVGVGAMWHGKVTRQALLLGASAGEVQAPGPSVLKTLCGTTPDTTWRERLLSGRTILDLEKGRTLGQNVPGSNPNCTPDASPLSKPQFSDLEKRWRNDN